MKEIELERTFLVKYLPEGLKNCKYKEIVDIYIPKSQEHPILRIRKNGDVYEMTKKIPLDSVDKSRHEEQTINLSKEEFDALAKLDGKIVRKIRYFYDFNGNIAEFDIFQDELEGLVEVDFEFQDETAKDKFVMPDFCLVDVTNEEFLAGGMLCGKSYEDIKDKLEKFGYKPF